MKRATIMHKKWAIYDALYILFLANLKCFWPILVAKNWSISMFNFRLYLSQPFSRPEIDFVNQFFLKKILGGFYQTSSHTKESILLLFNARKAVSMNVENHDDHGKCSCHFFQVARQGLFGVSHEKCFNIHK